ncbi:MAG: TetR/AcrR family transcriptional regulator [Tannerellaceae bacterium]|jgi:AcrR family transcriptional regulator|nr:TetR/AcrR family transcriptional regulator [Tannerellaceae bacterium]
MKTDETSGMESRIIEAAKRVFVRKGYEATTMGDIAAEVGISRTAMHYYFRTKEMMFESIFAQLIDAVLPDINLIMDEPTTIREKLPKIVDRYLNALRSNHLFPLFVINEMNRDMEHLLHSVAKGPNRIQVLMRFKQQVVDEMEKGWIRPQPLEDLVSTFISLIVFPILIRNVLITLFMDGKPEAFDDYLNRRRQLICNTMYHLMEPLTVNNE